MRPAPPLQPVLLLLVLAGCGPAPEGTAPPSTPPGATAAAPVAVDPPTLLDRWYVGRINGAPALNLHAVLATDEAGRPVAGLSQQLVISRELRGRPAVLLRSGSTGRYWTDAAGRVERFELDESTDGNRIVARGRIRERTVTATVLIRGRSQEVELTLPAAGDFLHWHAEYRAALEACPAVGDTWRTTNVALVNGSLMLLRPTYELAAMGDDGTRVFAQQEEVSGMQARLVLGPDGMLRSMTMDMLVAEIRVEPAETAAVLGGGAAVAVHGLVAGRGAPTAGADNRYALQERALAAVARDDFQEVVGGHLLVHRTCPDTVLEDPGRYLRATDRLELDEPELRAWVAGLLKGAPAAARERADLLAAAVRSHITAKGLDRADVGALATFRDRTGDCTEHATLLCAALRIADIPARIECGLIHSPAHGGWVGHAWTSAWLAAEGRWLHLDAAHAGIERSHYIACAGDPDLPGGLGMAMHRALAGIAGTTIEALGPP